MLQSSTDRYDYRIRIQSPLNTQEAVLLTYLKQEQHPILSHRDMVLMALRGYWLPLAYAHHLNYDRARLSAPDFQHLVKQAVIELREQANMLEQQLLAQNLESVPAQTSEISSPLH